ncbi:hypothetical protein F5Y15DRAFT_220869 [Xylariaceae sp. FL0016]|nr:hypothetical protein F5Y15DRAFT_220869 [Xylariaceae sp. FL0016]
MGLAGAKNKRKLDFDPNNTRWSRDETTFGQKILRAHGWTPGKFLGVQDASHAHLHTAASQAPIKVNLKDDTLGLGAKPRQKQSDECTGLNGFADLLGRLNGKSEATIKKEQEIRSELKTNLYVERRFGPMRFVRGGLLVGDDMKVEESAAKKEEEDVKVKLESDAEDVATEPATKQKEKKSKKRKAEEAETANVSEAPRDKKRKKRSRDESNPDGDSETSKPKKEKSKKSKSLKAGSEEEVESGTSKKDKKKSKKSKKSSSQDDTSIEDIPIKSEDAKAEKAKRKQERREKKEMKRKQIEAAGSTVEVAASMKTSSAVATPEASASSTPAGTGASTPLSLRHMSRSRHIASKRMAISDMQAMNQVRRAARVHWAQANPSHLQIFMVKPV